MVNALALLVSCVASMVASSDDWTKVCEIEERRGAVERSMERTQRRLEDDDAMIMYEVDGVASSGLPLTVLNGTRIAVRVKPGLHMDATLSPGVPMCGRRRRRVVHLDLTVGPRKSVFVASNTVVGGRRLLRHHHRRAGRDSDEYGAKPLWPPPEATWDRPASRATIRAVACAKNGTKIFHSRAVVTVVPSLSAAHERHCKKTPVANLPERNSPHVLEAVAEDRPDAEILVRNATKKLAAAMSRRGVLCDNKSPCEATLLDECPEKCENVAADDVGAECLFAGPSMKKTFRTRKFCIRVCVSPGARQHIWAADVSKGQDKRDKSATVCRVAHIHGLAAWYQKRAALIPFVARDNFDDVVWKRREGNTMKDWVGDSVIRAGGFPSTTPFQNQTLRRCAVVGSGHTLRCGTRWGPTIDSGEFAAVFRVNKAQFEPWVRADTVCRVGVRTDFVVNGYQGENARTDLSLPSRFLVRGLNALGGAAIAKSPTDYANARRALDRFKHSRYSSISDYRDYLRGKIFSSARRRLQNQTRRLLPTGTPRKIDRIPYRRFPGLYLPTRQVTDRLLGSGSGSTALVVALTVCRHVDLFGFGVFRSDDPADFRYLHFYQSSPGSSSSSSGGAQVLNSELRNHIFDAFGIANFIWW